MPQTEQLSDSDSQDGYTLVTAVPLMDGEEIQHDSYSVQDAPAHSKSTRQLENAYAEDGTRPSGQKQKPNHIDKTNKSLRPQTVARRVGISVPSACKRFESHPSLLQPIQLGSTKLLPLFTMNRCRRNQK